MPHISPKGEVKFWLNGSLIKVSKPKTSVKGKHCYGRRGKITGFSWASRLRLMRKIGKIDKRSLPQFLTLTYPDDYPHDLKEVKRQFDVFDKWLRRRFPGSGEIWKLEFQKRGAPHFHCLVWGIESAFAYVEIAKKWYQVVGSGDINHLKWHLGLLSGTRPCMQSVKSWRGVWSYASKYIGKVETEGDQIPEPGRFWGVRGLIPLASMVRASVTYKEAVHFMRLIRKACKLKSRDYSSVYGFRDANFWYERFGDLISQVT